MHAQHHANATIGSIVRTILACAVLGGLALLAKPAHVQAADRTATPLQVTIRVSEKGFLDETGRPYNAKRPLVLPKDAVVTMRFIFSEDLMSLAVSDSHQIAVRSEDGRTQESAAIWIMNRESSITLVAGENGRTHYRAYCILDCIGMEKLTNLIIRVEA